MRPQTPTRVIFFGQSDGLKCHARHELGRETSGKHPPRIARGTYAGSISRQVGRTFAERKELKRNTIMGDSFKPI